MMGIRAGKECEQIISFKATYVLIAIILAAGTITSCTKGYQFTMGGDFLDSQTKVTVLDTFRVDMSTVLLDSIITSSLKTGVVGSYRDDAFGAVTCESYFDFAFQEFQTIDEKAVFDSASLILLFDGYSYGDTTSLLTINVHKLSEKIVPLPTTSYLYNNTSFAYDPEITGTITFYPTPNSSDTSIIIPVTSLGEELFTLIMEKDQAVSSEEYFSEYLKGFVIKSEAPGNRSVISFKADKDHLKLKLYYHIDREEPEKKEISITMGSESHQFNNVRYDFSNTPIDSIKADGNEISSSRTDNMGFMQGLTGLIAKVRFPTVQDLLEFQRWKIIRAELVIEPAKGTYTKSSLPQMMYLYETNKENTITSVIKDSQGNALTAAFEYDEQYGEDTKYTYNITSFIINELSDAYFDSNHALMMANDQNAYRTKLDRLQIAGKNPPVKLRIFFLTY